jgi:hypothetical protein
MKSGDNAWVWQRRRFIVDVLIGAATVAVAFAAIGVTAQILDMLLIAGALVGIGLMLEPNVAAQPACDVAPQPLRRPAEADPKPAQPGPRAMTRLDAAIVDATSA